MPQRDTCTKRACPASASQGAGLPYPRRTRDWDHALALRSSTTLSPVSPQTNDAHDARMGRLSSSIEVRRSGSRCCRWRAQNGDGTSSLRNNMLIAMVLSGLISRLGIVRALFGLTLSGRWSRAIELRGLTGSGRSNRPPLGPLQ
jgi:hypothetical protein